MAIAIKTIFKNIYGYLTLVTGCLITTYIIFMRLIYVRLPRNLYTEMSNELLSIYIAILCLFIYSLLYTIYKKFFYQKNINQKDYFHYFRSILLFWYNSLQNFDNFIKGKFTTSWDILTAIGLFSYKNLYTNSIIEINILIFYIFPKIIVACIFLIDIIIYNKFNYFYKFSCLLLIPMIFNYIVYSIKYLSETNIAKLGEDIQIIDKDNTIYTPFQLTFKMLRKEYLIKDFDYEFELTPSNLAECNNFTQSQIYERTVYYVKIYNKMHKIFDFTMDVNFRKDRIIPYVNIIIYLLYIIGWSYIIWYGY